MGLNGGALSSWEPNNQSLPIGVMAPLDVSHLSGLETGLSEWSTMQTTQHLLIADATHGLATRPFWD